MPRWSVLLTRRAEGRTPSKDERDKVVKETGGSRKKLSVKICTAKSSYSVNGVSPVTVVALLMADSGVASTTTAPSA